MSSWREFTEDKPNFLEFAKQKLTLEVSYLGTVSKNGYPRVHPVTPIISDDNLFVFMEPTSPKGKDIINNGKYFLHSLVNHSDGSDGEFWIRGNAIKVDDKKLREEAVSHASYTPADRYILFQLFLEEAGGTTYTNGEPNYMRWKAMTK